MSNVTEAFFVDVSIVSFEPRLHGENQLFPYVKTKTADQLRGNREADQSAFVFAR